MAPAATVGTPQSNQVGGQLSEMLAAVLQVDAVSVDSHFFDDLGADSLVMAQFCARVRKHPELPSVTMKDVYQHPTIAALSAALAPAVTAEPEPSVPPPVEVAAPARRLPIILCGFLQLLIFLAYSYCAAFVTAVTFGWISAASGLVDTYLRSALAGGALFIAACLLPVLAKWVLIGRWKPHQEFRIWSLKYVRFWTVKTMIRANPIAIFAGSPLYALYLRLLGAKIGRGAVIMSKSVPVCTDLLTIGSGTVIRKQSFFQGYRAHAGRIQTGSVTIGSDVFIGDKTVLDINTGMGDGAQLGHTSALHSGSWVPAGDHWHGSPAQRTDVDYVRVPGLRCGTFRRVSAAILSLLGVFFIAMPFIQGGLEMVLSAVPSLAELVQPGQDAIGTPNFFLDAAVISLVLFGGGVVVGWLFVMTVPRALNLFITPEKVYPLYGLQYSLSHAITRMTNVKFFTHLFGNSSYSVYYLRRLGYKLFRIKQTGSNFGDEVAHDNPYLCSVGRGTVVADGLAMLNAEYSSTSIRLSRVAVGHRNFLGNNIAYPPQGRTGDNCLLATKVMIPLDGPIREGVGLLGSPPFEIPRSVERDNQFNQQRTPEDLRRGVAAKKRYNL
ncbi:MAG TPA: Pls/PosA family non-ribosomal peptide synthetase, partial [Nakamurella sp.]